jgi:hypothetical protein
MADMRLTVGCRRAVIKDIGGALRLGFYTLFKDLLVFPEFFDLLFFLDEIEVGGYAVIHCAFLLLEKNNAPILA